MRNAPLKFQPFPADGIYAGSEGKSAHEPLDVADACGHEPRLWRGSTRCHDRQHRSQRHRHVAGFLNATRQTGSVLGVALFGSLIGQADAFMAGAHAALIISASLLLAAAAIWRGTSNRASH